MKAFETALIFLILVSSLAGCSNSASILTDFDYETGPRVDDSRVLRTSYVMRETGERIPYAFFVPSDYTADRDWPLIVGFMGSGLHYDFLFGFQNLLDYADDYGYVIATPLGYVRGAGFGRGSVTEVNRRAEMDVFNVLNIIQDEYSIDSDKIYLWGHSAGSVSAYYHYIVEGKGPWSAFAMFAPPDNFTARTSESSNLEGFRILVQIGSDDTDGQALKAVEQMLEYGADASYQEVEGGHFLWMDSGDYIESLFKFFDEQSDSDNAT